MPYAGGSCAEFTQLLGSPNCEVNGKCCQEHGDEDPRRAEEGGLFGATVGRADVMKRLGEVRQRRCLRRAPDLPQEAKQGTGLWGINVAL